MSDIRDHGGQFGGNGLKPAGKEINLTAKNAIKKGQFVGLVNDPNQPLVAPTTTNPQSAYAYSNTTGDMSYSGFMSLISDAGNQIMFRGYRGYSNGWYALKPYVDSTGKMSALNYSFKIGSYMIFSVTKIDSNTFAIFGSYSTSDTTGLTMYIIRIDDTTGNPTLISTVNIATSGFYKNAYFLPFVNGNLDGVIVYSKGAYNYGTSDNCTSYWRKLTISAALNSVTVGTETQIRYYSGDSYGFFYNFRYTQDKQTISFTVMTVNYKIDWTSGAPVLTQLASNTGVTYNPLMNVIFRGNGAKPYTIYLSDLGDITRYDHDPINNQVTSTTLYNANSLYRLALGGESYEFSLIDSEYMSNQFSFFNNRWKQRLVPVGNYGFLCISGNQGASSPPTGFYAVIYYFTPDMAGIVGLTKSPSIAPINQYAEGSSWYSIDKDLKVILFSTAYAYYTGSGSYRYPYSFVYNVSAPIPPAQVSTETSVIHGIALNNADIGGQIKISIGQTANTDYIMGV